MNFILEGSQPFQLLMTFFITVSQNKEFFSASSIIKILGIFLIVVS